jgi:large subunit ribosomal protein L2
MPIKTFKPTTPSLRFTALNWSEEVARVRPEKRLTRGIHKTGGRNNQGRVTCRFRGGGHKRLYRQIDFKRTKDGIPAKVSRIEYDPNRSARIALLVYADGAKSYILAPKELKEGMTVVSGDNVEPRVGNCLPLERIPQGIPVHNVELQPGGGGQFCRSAGSFATIQAKEGRHALLTIPSGEVRKVLLKCRATVGQVGNPDHGSQSYGKAGRTRWFGRRPHVRGVAQNPVSHPLGGGEGRSHGGRQPCSPTGKLAKGKKTRSKRKSSRKLIVRSRKAASGG